MLKENKKIYLTLKLNKSDITQNNDKYFIFDVEASNENLDLEGQKILQSTLLDSKEYFLTNGVISKDHLHNQIVGEGENKKIIRDEAYIIGEPIEVYTKGNVTRVKGKLYKNNEYAKKFIRLLQAGSTRVKASVGGFLPIVKKTKEDGKEIEKVVSMLWNDLALTISPVNPTVEGAYILQRSFNGLALKALSAGYGTDSSQFSGGRAIISEDLECANEKVKLDEDIILFLSEVEKGRIKNKEEAQSFLSSLDVAKNRSLTEIGKVIENNRELLKEVLPMAKLTGLFPFLKKSAGSEDDEKTKTKSSLADDSTDKENVDLVNSDNELLEDGEIEDATPVLKSLSDSIELLNEKIEGLSKTFTELTEGQEVIGKALAFNIDQVGKIAGTPNPRNSAVNSLELIGKSMHDNSNLKKQHKQFTEIDKNVFASLLAKSVQSGELSVLDCGIIESQINKSIQNPSYQLDQQYIVFLEKKMQEVGLI